MADGFSSTTKPGTAGVRKALSWGHVTRSMGGVNGSRNTPTGGGGLLVGTPCGMARPRVVYNGSIWILTFKLHKHIHKVNVLL